MGPSFHSKIIMGLLPHMVMDMTTTLSPALNNENFKSIWLSIKGFPKVKLNSRYASSVATFQIFSYSIFSKSCP